MPWFQVSFLLQTHFESIHRGDPVCHSLSKYRKTGKWHSSLWNEQYPSFENRNRDILSSNILGSQAIESWTTWETGNVSIDNRTWWRSRRRRMDRLRLPSSYSQPHELVRRSERIDEQSASLMSEAFQLEHDTYICICWQRIAYLTDHHSIRLFQQIAIEIHLHRSSVSRELSKVHPLLRWSLN